MRPNDRLGKLLHIKRREDPDRFREYLPEVDELLEDGLVSRHSRARHRLTVQERRHHLAGLARVVEDLEAGALTSETATDGLRHCANLFRDDPLTAALDHETLTTFVKTALGKSPGSYRANTTVSITSQIGGPAVDVVPAIRGVYLDLDLEGRLVSISLRPTRFRERRKLMSIVGAGSDPGTDVAARHDDYLVMQDPHGGI